MVLLLAKVAKTKKRKCRSPNSPFGKYRQLNYHRFSHIPKAAYKEAKNKNNSQFSKNVENSDFPKIRTGQALTKWPKMADFFRKIPNGQKIRKYKQPYSPTGMYCKLNYHRLVLCKKKTHHKRLRIRDIASFPKFRKLRYSESLQR